MAISREEPVEFGPFRLFATQRRLLVGDTPVAIGSRALDILIMLVEHAGQVVSKRALMARAWAGLTVEEASLRAQIAALRRALGDGERGSRYIANVVGRGYSFVAPIASRQGAFGARPRWRSRLGSAVDPSGPSVRMVGRDVEVRLLANELARHRLVTIHGPGGVGKTVAGLAVADLVLPDVDEIFFLDLSLLEPGGSVADALAAELGLIVHAEDPIPGAVNYLRDRRALVVLDGCEHVIASAAGVAQAICRDTASIRLLATSREPLRCEGEQVFPLAPLGAPPEAAPESLEDLLRYPAALLFHDRIVAGGHRRELTSEELDVVAGICRKADGVALALELAAGRVGIHGLRETAALLDSHLKLTWPARDVARERHQTLAAMLDWSHELASVRERTVLRRLSTLVGPFTLDEAQAVAADGAIDGGQVAASLAELVAKSLIVADARRTPPRYRLLDTTRAYAQAKLLGSGEESRTARAHAMLCERLLRRREALGGQAGEGATPAEVLGNVRAALDWCFRPGGDVALGVRLAAVATQVFFDLSLLRECREWAERALSALRGEADPRSEMALCSALGHGLMFTRGGGEASRAALERGLKIAVALGDRPWRFRLLAGLHMHQRRLGRFRELLPIAQEAQQLAATMSDPAALSAAQAMLGVTHHLRGELASARQALTQALHAPPGPRQATANAFGFTGDTRILLARTLWLQGYPDQAILQARMSEPAAPQDPVSTCLALIWSASLLHWVGDWDREERLLGRLVQLATEHALEPYKWVGVGFQGDLRVRSGEAEVGVEMMRSALDTLRAGGYAFNTPWLGANLAAGLAVLGQADQALRHMDEALSATDQDARVYNLPDLWRIQGEILAQAGDLAAAQRVFERSIALADVQGALSWRLRTATSLARLTLDFGRPAEGRRILAETYGRFSEGFDTVDLRAARTVLEAMARA